MKKQLKHGKYVQDTSEIDNEDIASVWKDTFSEKNTNNNLPFFKCHIGAT